MPSRKTNKREAKVRNDIVTAFIEYRGKILLLRRSQKVKTMKGKWAGVSGYIERSEAPVWRAITEIKEETGFTDENIKLLKQGKPLEAADSVKPNNITWVVHPFYFRSNTDKIQLDWEHDACKWIDPSEIEKFDTVPRLKESFDRVRSNPMHGEETKIQR